MECHGVPMDFQTRSSKLIYLTMLLAFFHPFPFAPLDFEERGLQLLTSWSVGLLGSNLSPDLSLQIFHNFYSNCKAFEHT